MKKILIILMVAFFSVCVFSQEINRIIIDPNIEKEILYGYCDRAGLASGQFKDWFEPEYQSYMVNDSILFMTDLDLLFSCNIIVVLGTWCSDSQREVPRLFKIIDYVHFPEYNLKMICIDRKKNADETEVQDLKIELVPTIIFFQGSNEIGRIIESPSESLEADIVRILTQ